MKSIPVDVTAFGGWMCVSPPEVKSNPRTGEVRTDAGSGLSVFVVGVVAIRGRDSSVIQVSVPGEPKGLVVGTALRLVALEAVPWDIDGRSGVTFRAGAVLVADAPDPGRRPGIAPLTAPGSGAPGSGGRGGEAN